VTVANKGRYKIHGTYNYGYNKSYTRLEYILYKIEIIFPQSRLHFQHTFSTFAWGTTLKSERHVQTTEVKTTNWKVSAEQEEESNPPLARQRQTAYQSAQKGGRRNNGVDCSRTSSLQSRFSILRLASFWLPKECTTRTPFCGRRRTETAWVKGSDTLAEFFATDVQRLTQSWKKCVDNEGNFVEK
jgi:hypothetical protein